MVVFIALNSQKNIHALIDRIFYLLYWDKILSLLRVQHYSSQKI